MYGQTTFDRSSIPGDSSRLGWFVAPQRGGTVSCVGGERHSLGPRHTTTGTVCAKPQGGDTRSHHIEALSKTILSAVEAQKDISLDELADLLRARHDASFATSTIWRFLNRHGLSFKKNSPRSRAGTARRRRAATGLVRSPA